MMKDDNPYYAQKKTKKDNQKKILSTLFKSPSSFSHLVDKTGLSKPVLSNHLKFLKKEEFITKDFLNGKAVYKLTKKGYKLPFIHSLVCADKIIDKNLKIINSFHHLNFNIGLLLVSFLKKYLKNPSQNEESFNQDIEYQGISLIRRYFEILKWKMKDLAEKDENTEQILEEFQEQILKHYNFLFEEMILDMEDVEL
jgi:DNA-binding HxlR family transcriptional regulator